MQFQTFEERFNYLKLNSAVCEETFGIDRYLNQVFYKSKRWLSRRNEIIIRDNACDLAIPERQINESRFLRIHHMNPLLLKDIVNETEYLLNPEYLITTIHSTHNAIHYGDWNLIVDGLVERRPNDTCPWR